MQNAFRLATVVATALALAFLSGSSPMAAPSSLDASTASVAADPDTGAIVWPTGHALAQTFTSATRAATVPRQVGAMGWETDTGETYRATGTTAGDWAAVIVPATDATAGVVELATAAETQAGADAARAVTPAGLHAVLSTADSSARLVSNGAGGFRLELWNDTQGLYQEIRLAGAAGEERLTIVD